MTDTNPWNFVLFRPNQGHRSAYLDIRWCFETPCRIDSVLYLKYLESWGISRLSRTLVLELSARDRDMPTSWNFDKSGL